jgi:hypothetical protein
MERNIEVSACCLAWRYLNFECQFHDLDFCEESIADMQIIEIRITLSMGLAVAVVI